MKEEEIETLYSTGRCARSYPEERGEKSSISCPGLCISEFYFAHTDAKRFHTVVKVQLKESEEVEEFTIIPIK